MKLKLSIFKSASENASIYYEKYKKLKEKLDGARKALEKTLKEIEKVEKESYEEKKIEIKKVVKKEKKWYEKFRWFFISNDFLVIGGKDSKQNEILIKRYLSANDLVFHADIPGAAFFVLKNPEGKEVPPEIKLEAATLAGVYSKAWKLNLASVDVYCVKPEQISKKAPAKTFLAKGAFMIYGKREWFRNIELKLAIGISLKDDALEVIAGPISAVSSKTDIFAVIKPGYKKSKELALEIKEFLAKNLSKEIKEKINALPLEEIQKWIPAGKGTLAKKWHLPLKKK
ncbi:MAG TPA: DUF814 domain-containing protein [Candidatus Altiarchaeales archaeon]|nr:MAG: hypothetical protein DRO65_03155 [Candidatus Altiarchaeales archaeon]HDN82891.1 DUF814 domain-containing protein [Candidatus Altiarchaeales archaeon]